MMGATTIVAQITRLAGDSLPLSNAPQSIAGMVLLLCGMVAMMALVRSTVRSRSPAKFVILLCIGVPTSIALLMPMMVVTSSAPVTTSSSHEAIAVVSGDSASVTRARDANAPRVAPVRTQRFIEDPPLRDLSAPPPVQPPPGFIEDTADLEWRLTFSGTAPLPPTLPTRSVDEESAVRQSSPQSDATPPNTPTVAARQTPPTHDQHQRVHNTSQNRLSWRRLGALTGSIGLSLAMIYFLLEGFTKGHFRGVLIVVTAAALVGAWIAMVQS